MEIEQIELLLIILASCDPEQIESIRKQLLEPWVTDS